MKIKVRSANFEIFFLLLLLCLCICFSGSIREEMLTAVTRCLTVIIPSLYAMMILSQMLIATGIWRILARPLRRITPKLFGMPDACFALLLLSQVGGYPVGASMISALEKDGTLQREDASRLLCVCYGSGPAFLLGMLGTQSQSFQRFLLIFVSNLMANLFLTIILFHHHPIHLQKTSRTKQITPLNASVLVQSTERAGQTLLRLCGIILCFSGITAMLDSAGLFHLITNIAKLLPFTFPLPELCKCFLEITNTVTLSLPLFQYLPILSGLLSFGGFCVILQIRAVAGKIASMQLFLPIRFLSCLLSALFCRIGMHFISWELPLDSPVVPASAVSVKFRHETLFPACMLLIMILLLFRETYDLQKSESNAIS